MAYALRYYKEIPQGDGSVIRLEIHKKDSTTSPVEIGAVLQGLSLEIQGQQDEIDVPIVKTSLSMTFVDASDLENGQKNGFWEEFYTPDAVLWRVILKAKKAQETDFLPIWGGYVTPDSFSETLIYRGSVNIIARDNLGHLQDFPFDAQGDSNGMISLFNLVNAGMAKIETPMDIQWAAGVLWMQTEGVCAYDTLMNVSAFEGKNWYEAIEEALYSYGATMRYVGGNMISIAPLRYLPSQGMESVDAVPRIEPRFAVGATRELIPAVRRIEESVGYDLEAEFQPRILAQDFSGNSFDVQTSWGSVEGIAWSLVYTTPMFRFGWYNEVPFKTLAFSPRAYEVRNITSEDDVRNIQENTCILTGTKDDNTYSLSYAMQVEAEDYAINITFGKWLARLSDGMGNTFLSYPFDEPPTDYEVKYAIKVESNGVTYYLSLNGEWVSEMAAHTIEVTGDKMSVNVPLSGRFMGNVMVSLVFLNINTHENRVRIKQILALSLSPVDNKPMQETNNVYTNYVQENNVILTRDPQFAPAMNSVALPAFIGNGIFYQRGDSVLPARSWGWQGGSTQQMAVWNHLSLLSYYAKPNNLVSGTIVNADITGGACIYVWKDKEHILVSGRYNYLTEQIEGAVLREFARYEDMWSEVAGAELPTTEESSRSNVESEGASAAPASTYTSTQTVNIGSTGGGGGTGASYLNDLLDVNVANAGAQSLLYYNGTEWVARSFATLMNPYLKSDVAQETYATKTSFATLEAAVQDNAGNIKKNFDAIGVLQSGKADKATTLAGYGIQDAYTQTETDDLLAKYVLLNAANQTIKGNIRIEGNLVVTGDTASGGASGGGGTSIGVSGIFVNGETRRDDDGDGIIVLPDYPTSLEWSAINGKPTKLSEFTDDILAGKYLPLAGGSISGNLAVQGQITANTLSVFGQNGMTVSRLVTSVVRSTSSIEFQANNGTLGKANSIRLSTGQLAPIGEDKELISLGNSNARWKDVYAVGGDFSGVLNVQGLVAQEAVVGGKTVLTTGNYSDYALPLSGGTVTGTIEFTASTPALKFYRDYGNVPYIHFGASPTSGYGEVGADKNGNLVFWSLVSGNSAYNAWNTVLHAKNIGDYALKKVANVTSLNTNAGEFFYSGFRPAHIPYGNYVGGITLQTFRDAENDYRTQLAFSTDAKGFVRSYTNGSWSGWKTIAFTDSNVASAQALKHSNGTIGAVVNSSGNVTIGGSDTAGADYKLRVDGTSRFTDRVSVTSLRIIPVNGSYAADFAIEGSSLTLNRELKFTNVTASDICSGIAAAFKTSLAQTENLIARNIILGASSGSASNLALNFQKYTSISNTAPNGLTTLMTLTTDGNLGIGTTNPAYKLDVAGSIGCTGGFAAPYFYKSDEFYIGSGALGVSASGALIYTYNNLPIYFFTSGTAAMTIDSGHRVTMEAGLHVKGNFHAGSTWSEDGTSGTAGVTLRNEGGIELTHASTPYIDFHYAAGTTDFSHRLIARASNIFAYSGNYFCPWGSESLGASSYRWKAVYAKAGNFLNDMEINGALTVGGTSTFNGDVRINGNLVVTGDTASGGAGQETTSTSQLLVINQIIPEGTSVTQSALDAIGLTSDVIDDLIDGKYHHVLEVIGSNKSLYTISGYKSTTTREFILQYGSAEADTAWWYSFRQYNGGNWSVVFDEI